VARRREAWTPCYACQSQRSPFLLAAALAWCFLSVVPHIDQSSATSSGRKHWRFLFPLQNNRLSNQVDILRELGDEEGALLDLTLKFWISNSMQLSYLKLSDKWSEQSGTGGSWFASTCLAKQNAASGTGCRCFASNCLTKRPGESGIVFGCFASKCLAEWSNEIPPRLSSATSTVQWEGKGI